MKLKYEDCSIVDNHFDYLGKTYDCKNAIKDDVEMIIKNAKLHKKFNEYNEHSLRADRVRLYIDENNKEPVYGMIIYSIENIKFNYRREACGNYYPISDEFGCRRLEPHWYQASICW